MKRITGGRLDALEHSRALKTARSTHAYVRGNTVKFYEWLAESRSARRLPKGPAIWICGDCHLGNLGPVADAEGRVDVQIRDLDQSVIGNPAHDLIRLGLSLATAARGSDLPGITTARMIEEMVEGYAHAMAAGDADMAPEPNVVRAVRRRALAAAGAISPTSGLTMSSRACRLGANSRRWKTRNAPRWRRCSGNPRSLR